MKKTKKLVAVFGVALMLLAPVLGLIPPTEGKASAITNSTASVEQQVKSYIYMRAISRCLEKAGLVDGTWLDVVSTDHANDYEWFNGGLTEHQTYLGLTDSDNYDGKKDCNDKDWMGDAFDIWGWDDPVTAICYSGFKRANASDGQNAEACREGSGEFKRDGGGEDAGRQFRKNVNKQFYGKEDSAAWPTMTKAMEYYYYRNSFILLCKADPFPAGDSWTDATVNGDKNVYRTLGPDGTTVETWKADKEKDDSVTTRTNESLDEVKLKCGDMADKANDPERAKAFNDEANANPEENEGTIGGGADSGAIDTKCAGFEMVDVLTLGLDWVMCPIIAGATSAANALEDSIAGMLCINESDIFGTDMTCSGEAGSAQSRDAFHNAWNVFRILALGLLAIGGLIMIISQAFGFEIFDAYTVKKTLPRILVAGIGITLSWQLLEFLVTFSNALGIGVRALIYAPFIQSGANEVVLEGGSRALGLLFAGGAFAILGPLGLLSFIGTALLAILIAFFLLVIRNIIIIMLILIAPIAIAMYILPNTEKYWNIWWDWFSKALLVFPIITAFIAVGHVFAAITSTKGSGTLTNFVAFAAYFAPYFLIPLAFRFAGGALGTIGGFANDRSRGAFDGLKRFRKARSGQNWQAIQENRRFNPNAHGFMGKVNRRVNSGLSNISSPGGAAKYYGGSALRKAGVNTSIGMGIANQIDESRFNGTQKAVEHLMNKQLNDQALRSLMGMQDVSAKSIREESARLSNSDDVNARIAGNQLSSYATSLATDMYKDPEMGRASIQAAAGLALAQHGFADPDDIAKLGNNLGGTESGFANAVVGQAQMNSMRAGRSDFKPGYSVRLGPGGQFEGTTDMQTRGDAIGIKTAEQQKQESGVKGRAMAGQIQKLKGIGTYEMQQSKPQSIKGLAEGYVHMLSSEAGNYKYADERGQDWVTDPETGERKDLVYSFSEADQKRILDQFTSMKSGHSGANADQIAEIDKILAASGKLEFVNEQVKRQSQPTLEDMEASGRIPKK